MAKILIFTSHGGGGHVSASNALYEYLSEEHTVTITPLIINVFGSIDPIMKITRKKYHAEDAYNYFLKKKYIRLLNYAFCKTAFLVLPFLKKKMIKILGDYVQTESPDIIISVVPFFNEVIKNVTTVRKIPFLIVPTDLDCSTFIKNVQVKPDDVLSMTLAFDNPLMWDIILKKNKFPKENVIIAGFPLRKTFFQPKNNAAIKQEFSLPFDRPIALLLMGAVGTQALVEYLTTLASLETPLHIIVCLGKNEKIRSSIRKIKLGKNISISIMGFTDRIADLMAASDFCISKAGSVSINEAMYMNVPLILDHTAPSLLWEHFNFHFIKHMKFGDILYDLKDLKSLVIKYCKDVNYRNTLKNNLVSCNKEDFGYHINTIVNKMLSINKRV
jgi:processive 1,2-diacylglycerol beta-glucosyltransferase